jgi:sec-independent protein translocase protein TatC
MAQRKRISWFRHSHIDLAECVACGLNPAAAGMYLLKKIIQFRENSHPDHEKPFLEHLEDLRIMITRIVVTLLVSMLVCFVFQKRLMDVLRLPVERMWAQQIEEKLPREKHGPARPVDLDLWEKAKEIEHAASGLDAGARGAYYTSLDADLAFHAQSIALLRAANALPEDARAGFLDSAELSAEMRKQVDALLQSAPSPEMASRGNLRLMSALRPTETFMLSMKLSFFAGIVVSFPLLLMYVLQFVLPGLHSHERRMMWPALLIGFGLFLCGVCFAYFVVLPRALDFFHDWSGSLGVSNDWRIGEYISFATRFTLLFGLSFELPVVVMVLVKLGLLSYETMSNSRSYAVLAIFVTAAILTPTPDAFTLILMAVPMLVLYEICIWLAWYDARRNRLAEETEAREREERLLALGGPVNDAGVDAMHGGEIGAGETADDGYSEAYEQDGQYEFFEYPPIDGPAVDPDPGQDDPPKEKSN